MKRFLTTFALALLALSALAQVKPVTGTFLNFFWQDERNNYMNPRGIDNTDPDLWRVKMEELHEIGVDWVVLVAVANEGRAIYPSSIMERGYDQSRKSPIDAVMDAADSLGMHVFMSCGHARNQLDNLSDPFVVRRQREMIEELSSIYGERPAFYGWYLPVEGCMIPWLPDAGIKGVNEVAASARELTPGVKIMISPYGIFNGDFSNPKFAEQIYKLDVDIIAYQDEIGCVREDYPMREMKEHFRMLADIHAKCGIELWANIESFTWDRRPNNWFSTLIPAAFGRYLSQLVGVSQAGVTRVISFAVAGIFDKPGSAYPLGQPVYSAKAWENYRAWLGGDRRWKLLEKLLLDDSTPFEDPSDPRWQVFGSKMEHIVDLGCSKPVHSVAGLFLDSRRDGIDFPRSFEVLVSDDGNEFRHLATVTPESWPNDYLDTWSDVVLVDLSAEGACCGAPVSARFVKVRATVPSGRAIYCSRILINP